MRFFVAGVLVAVLFSVVSVPGVAFADTLLGPLVEDCEMIDSYSGRDGSNFSGACQLCDLVDLAYNVIYFGAAFTVVVATLMFLYAGILYFTAAAKPENIKKANGIFVKVLAGMVIVLTAFLVVDLIMKTLLNDRQYGFWKRPGACIEYPVTDSLSRATTDGVSDNDVTVNDGRRSGDGVEYSAADELNARSALQGKVNINRCEPPSNLSIANCAVCESSSDPDYPNCTNVGGLDDSVVTYISNVLVPYARSIGCGTLTITGGSEGGHSDGGGHDNGSAFDLRTDCEALNEASARLGDAPSQNGFRWYRHSSPNDHWHVECVTNACRD